jgi:glycosyltransferase A (GT-A) superfamily protein (DUF2064 family)
MSESAAAVSVVAPDRPAPDRHVVARPAAATPAPAVLVMARSPRRGEVRKALESILGPDGCLALQAVLIRQALEWARSLEPRAIYVAHEPADARPEMRLVTGPDVGLFPQNGDGISGRMADAVARVAAHGPGPIVIVWPDLPEFRQAHAVGVIADLDAGVDVVFGPVFDGGYYLIAISRPLPSLFALPEQVWRAADAISQVVSAADQAGLEVGLLRAERALHRPADVRAALADPLLPAAVARVLGGH